MRCGPKVCRSSAWMPGTRMPPSRSGQPKPTGAMPGAWPRCCAWAGTARCRARALRPTSAALLAARHRLVTMRVDLDGQIRGILKTFGLIAGPGNSDAFLRRAEALAEGHAVLAPLVTCLAQVRRHVATQISVL